MKLSIRLKLKLFIGALFISAIINTLFTFQLENYGDEKLKWVNHTHQVLHTTDTFLGAVKNTETGQRGFLLTNNINYLEPYHSGITAARNSFNQLKDLTSDNQKQQQRLDRIEKLVELKFEEMEQTIKLKENNLHGQSIALVKRNLGKQYMDEIRKLLLEFTYEENLLLETRKGDLKAVRVEIQTIMYVEIIIFVVLGIFTILFLNKNLFEPLNLLLTSTQKMDKGDRVEITDITSDDEMGFLLSSFFKMNQKVQNRTEELDYKAHHDELTGLQNRLNLYSEIDSSINNAIDTQTKIALLFIDLNKFKVLNDTMGHNAGDVVLKETANKLVASIRKDDVVFRLGGDEFLILLKNCKDVNTVEKIIPNILTSFREPVRIHGKEVNISLSIGVAIFPDNSKNPEELIKMADIAMYVSKNDSSQNYKLFEKNMSKRSDDSKII